MIVIKKKVSILLILSMIICSFTFFSCTNHANNAEKIEINIVNGIKSEKYYLLGTMNGSEGYKLWVEISNGEPRFVLLQPFTSSVMYHGENFEIDISQNKDLKAYGDKLFVEYGEAITGVFDFDIGNPLWQGGIVHLFAGKIYYVTRLGRRIELNLQ